MVLDNKCAIIGYGGHAYVVAESYFSIENNLTYYTNINKILYNPFNLEYLGFELDINYKGWGMSLNYILGLGDNKLREKVANLLLSKSQVIKTVIDPKSIISNSANIGVGIYASKGVLVNSFSSIGDFVILNTGCIIEHECQIDTAAHIAPGAVLAGNVKIGKRCFIGANSVIKQGVIIGDDVIIGAGAVVLKDVESNSKIVGNPGRKI